MEYLKKALAAIAAEFNDRFPSFHASIEVESGSFQLVVHKKEMSN